MTNRYLLSDLRFHGHTVRIQQTTALQAPSCYLPLRLSPQRENIGGSPFTIPLNRILVCLLGSYGLCQDAAAFEHIHHLFHRDIDICRPA